MKKEVFKRKDGSEGAKYIPQVGDKVKSKYQDVRTITFEGGLYENHSLGVEHKDEDIFITLTKGQKTSLDKAGDLTGKTLEFYAYKNDYGEFVGVKVV